MSEERRIDCFGINSRDILEGNKIRNANLWIRIIQNSFPESYKEIDRTIITNILVKYFP